MGAFIIEGGAKLEGKIEVESAKNAVLPILCGAILTDQTVNVLNCPNIIDVNSLLEILKSLGVKVCFNGKNIGVSSNGLNSCEIPPRLAGKLRSSIFLVGAMLARCGRVVTSVPGGCAIGQRPIDIHIKALGQLGVKCRQDGERLTFEADKIIGANIRLPFPSVGATENVILASVFCEGKTVLKNCAREPEIVDLANFLNKMGAKISGAGKRTIVIEGVKRLKGVDYLPIGDRIEGGTYLASFLITGGKGEIHGVNSENIRGLTNIFCNNTCKIDIVNDIIYVASSGRLKAVSVATKPFPLFPTDMQAQITALACACQGQSKIRELLFEDRFNHVGELAKMGADISVSKNTILVNGVSRLNGARVYAKDLRGGAGLVLAGLGADGVTVVEDIYHIDRGYQNLEKKLQSIGAKIKRV